MTNGQAAKRSSVGSAGTRAALACKQDGVLLEREAAWKKSPKTPGTAFEVVHAVAAAAVEVVMMVRRGVGEFVARLLARDRHRMDLPGVLERAQVAVDGALADRSELTDREFVQFVRRKGPCLARDDLEQHAALPGRPPERMLGGRGRMRGHKAVRFAGRGHDGYDMRTHSHLQHGNP